MTKVPSSLVVGISSRSLFNLAAENQIFEEEGVEAYRAYQRANEDRILEPGTAFPLVQALLGLNTLNGDRRLVDVVVMSRNSPDSGLRILRSIEHHELDITRAAFAGGSSLAPYLDAYGVDLFLSKSEQDVQSVIDAGGGAALIYDPPDSYDPDPSVIRIAFDGDAVLFNEDSELIYREQGVEAFAAHERDNAHVAMKAGPLAKLLKILSFIQKQAPTDKPAVRIALITARGGAAQERVIRTLREWDVHVDEAYFLGGALKKDQILKAFRAHIFFDDQDLHLENAAKVVPSARVFYPSNSALRLKTAR